ncbi:RNA methyltransferase TrmH, group 3 [Candidatus Magnetomorum sp. HK-1]|nr:RNA methyltransferase TrmH, group 3 [Candidatus Magnetomorum sp. HK-1]
MKTEFLYGIHPVQEALNAKKRTITNIYISQNIKNNRIKKIADIAKKRNIKLSTIPSTVLAQKVGHDYHQNVIAQVSFLPLVDINQMIETTAFIIICDHIMDPHNMGAIIRTALAAGVTGIITTRDHSSPFSASVSRASAGAMEHIPVARVTNLVRTMKQLKNEGLWLMGLDGKSQQSIYNASFTDPLALVIGGEEKGMRRLVHETCDQVLCIPQLGPLDSLNASVAGAIAMYEVFRQRV